MGIIQPQCLSGHLCCGVQEEIAHCAAGVRWLTYLHKQAIAASNTQQNSAAQPLHTAGQSNGNAHDCSRSQPDNDSYEQMQQSSQQISISQPAGCNTCHHDNLQQETAGTSSACNGVLANDVDSTVQKDFQGQHQQAAAHDLHKNSPQPCPLPADDDTAAFMHAWQVDAAKYSTVEQWFHALVRTHFKGSLKVSFCSTAATALAQSVYVAEQGCAIIQAQQAFSIKLLCMRCVSACQCAQGLA